MANPTRVLSRVTDVMRFGEGVYQVTLSVPSRNTRFQPGQFLHLTLDEFDPTTGYWPESRVFSIASEPRSDHVAIVYSVKGAYTKRMELELVVGKDVWIKLPYGSFVIDEGLLARGPLVLIAGGTGISPYIPFLKGELAGKGNVHLFYGIRTPEHLLFRQELGEAAQESWLNLHLMIESGAVSGLPFNAGRLSTETVVQAIGEQFRACHYYLSGPPVMITTFKADLSRIGIDSAQIHIDEWD